MRIFNAIILNVIISFICLIIMPSTFAATFSPSKSKHIYYTDGGFGKPMVLIHAFPTDLRLWNPQQNSLQKHFRVISGILPLEIVSP